MLLFLLIGTQRLKFVVRRADVTRGFGLDLVRYTSIVKKESEDGDCCTSLQRVMQMNFPLQLVKWFAKLALWNKAVSLSKGLHRPPKCAPLL
eukprot:1668160-Amphidinium_carterae.1